MEIATIKIEMVQILLNVGEAEWLEELLSNPELKELEDYADSETRKTLLLILANRTY